jgi:transposase
MHCGRRVHTRTAAKNQLLAQLDRCFPGRTMVLPDVLGTKVGHLIAAEFADPHRLAALGVSRFVRFAAHRGLPVRRSAAERLAAAARAALPSAQAQVARSAVTIWASRQASSTRSSANTRRSWLSCQTPRSRR